MHAPSLPPPCSLISLLILDRWLGLKCVLLTHRLGWCVYLTRLPYFGSFWVFFWFFIWALACSCSSVNSCRCSALFNSLQICHCSLFCSDLTFGLWLLQMTPRTLGVLQLTTFRMALPWLSFLTMAKILFFYFSFIFVFVCAVVYLGLFVGFPTLPCTAF